MTARSIVFEAGGCLHGEMTVPGDKSISHRACLLGAIASGDTEIINFLPGEDNLHSLHALQTMGIHVSALSPTHLRIQGVGKYGLRPPLKPLYLGNSGTGMRLLAGLLAGQSFSSQLIGDESLSKRPMQRIIVPLTQMGANISTEDGALLLQGTTPLRAIDYAAPLQSAQVKSCLLFAGLYAEGTQIIREPTLTRNHTEYLLKQFGASIKTEANVIRLEANSTLLGTQIQIPGDFSSAAFFIVGALISQHSDLILKNIGLNPTRTGLLTLLKSMGATIEILEQSWLGHECVGTLRVKSSHLSGIHIPGSLIPATIDEFPILFIAAACAQGETRLTHAPELRVKESDRLRAMAQGLGQLGIEAKMIGDGISIQGGQIQGGCVDSFNDHRVAMAFAIASLASKRNITVLRCANIATSFPNFLDILRAVII